MDPIQILQNSKKYKFIFFYGFPKNFNVYKILNTVKLHRQSEFRYLQKSILSDLSFIKLDEDYRLHEYRAFKLIQSRIPAIQKTRIFSILDFICIINLYFEVHHLHFCDWAYVSNFYRKIDSNIRSLLGSIEDLTLVWFYFQCFYNKDAKLINVCPNPCRVFNERNTNPCLTKLNLINEECELIDKQVLVYANNYKCNCKKYFQWNQNLEECVPIDLCKLNDDYQKTLCGDLRNNSLNCEMELHTRNEITLTGFDYHINCLCSEEYMGIKCDQLRNPCDVPFEQIPPGYQACGPYSKCVPLIGSKYFLCECKSGFYYDPQFNFSNCLLRGSGYCVGVDCKHGFCKHDARLNQGECICDDGWYGDNCHKKKPEWLIWEEWSECVPKCGLERIRTRTRYCSYEGNNEKPSCFENGELGPSDFQLCEINPCQNEAYWSNWESWNHCSAICGSGIKTRERVCIHTYALNMDSGSIIKPCPGFNKEVTDCKLTGCSDKLIGFLGIILIPILFFGLIFTFFYYAKKFLKLRKNKIRNVDVLNEINMIETLSSIEEMSSNTESDRQCWSKYEDASKNEIDYIRHNSVINQEIKYRRTFNSLLSSKLD